MDERRTRELADGLEQGLGARTTELLMEHVVALSDLTAKVDTVAHKVDALDHKVDVLKYELTAEIHRVGRNQLLGFAAIVAIFNTGLFAVVAWVRL